MSVNEHMCETPDCGKKATLQCPTCLKIGIQGSFFCGQECFKGYWKSHKIIHLLASKLNTLINIKFTKIIVFWHSLEGSGDGQEQNNEYRPWPYYSFTGKLRPYPQTDKRPVPELIQRPDYADHPKGRSLSEESLRGNTTIKVLNDDEIEAMKVSSKLGREVLDEAAKAIAVGVTTDEIDRVVHEACIERDCYPSPLNYYNFPKSCCTSVNEVICHGIPDTRPLEVSILYIL